MRSSLPAAVVLIPFFAALALPLLHRLSARLVHPVAVAAAAAALGASALQAARVVRSGSPLASWLGGWAPPWGIELRVDHLGAIMSLLVTVLSLVVLVFAREGLDRRLRSRGHLYYSLYLLFTTGLVGFVQTGDLFNLYVFLEVIALTGYALVAVGEPDAPLAAFRYVVIGTLGASFYLLGLAYVYGLTGSLNFVDVAARLPGADGRTAFVALAFLVAGFGIKAALFPLHAWLPDAYTHAPSVTSAFMAAVGTKVGAYAIFRVLFTVFGLGPGGAGHPVMELLGWMSATGVLAGSILALAQHDLKRMLAYSSVSQIGYVLLGFSLGNAAGVIGAILHVINHALMKACLFMAVGAVEHRLGHRDLRRLGGLGHDMPVAMASFTVGALSMIGLPPTAGFFSKWYLVLGSVEGGRWPFVVIILVSSLLNAVYFFRVLETVYLTRRTDPSDPHAPAPPLPALPRSMTAAVALTAVALVLLGLGSWPIVEHAIRFAVPAGF